MLFFNHISGMTAIFSILVILSSIVLPVTASPMLAPATANNLQPRKTTNFAATCKDVFYYGYCRLEANCTTDGSTVGANKHAKYQHTFLDLGQCIKYESKQLKWRYKSIGLYQSTYCAPCSQCTLDPSTTLMTCECEYTNAKDNHFTQLRLSDRVWNRDGVLGCMDVVGDVDPNP